MKEKTLMFTTEGNRTLLSRGKVRDVYDMGDALLIVATDRISCFDVVLPTPIPGKGCVLTQMSRFWFDALTDVIPHHFLSTDLSRFTTDPDALEELAS